MFNRTEFHSDDFLDIKISSRLLYVYLCLDADDDGMVANAKSITRLAGIDCDDLNELVEKGYIFKFDSGRLLIRDWNVHNHINRNSTDGHYHPTLYQSEFCQFVQDEDSRYVPSTRRQRNVNEPSPQQKETERNRIEQNQTEGNVKEGKEKEQKQNIKRTEEESGNSVSVLVDEDDEKELLDYVRTVFLRKANEEDRKSIHTLLVSGYTVSDIRGGMLAASNTIMEGKAQNQWAYVTGTIKKIKAENYQPKENDPPEGWKRAFASTYI